MDIASNYPLNVCLTCGGELKVDYTKDVYICKDCGEEWPREMLFVTKQNIEDPKSMR